jgi:hypothetical protein
MSNRQGYHLMPHVPAFTSVCLQSHIRRPLRPHPLPRRTLSHHHRPPPKTFLYPSTCSTPNNLDLLSPTTIANASNKPPPNNDTSPSPPRYTCTQHVHPFHPLRHHPPPPPVAPSPSVTSPASFTRVGRASIYIGLSRAGRVLLCDPSRGAILDVKCRPTTYRRANETKRAGPQEERPTPPTPLLPSASRSHTPQQINHHHTNSPSS